MLTHLKSLSLCGLLIALSTQSYATVYSFFGDAIPTASVIEGDNGATNGSLLTTILFPGTSWGAEDGFLKMNTGPGLGVWFGTSNSGYGDNSGIRLSDTLTGNRILSTFLLTPGSQSWGFYFYDQNGYGASVQVEQTDNGQNRPGVWVSLDSGDIQVSDEFFNPNVLHTFEAHIYDGQVVYRLDGEVVATGLANKGGRGGLTVIGDGSGSTRTGTGSMWIDYLEIDNAAGEFSLTLIPEPAHMASMLGLVVLGFGLRRRR